MNRITKISLGLLSAIVLLTSCQISHKSASVGVEDVKKSGFVMTKPLISDIEVENQKIEGKAVISNKLYLASAGGPQAAAINLAIIDAVTKASCDILVQPVYEIENSGTYTTATVSGFAGRYKGFREITPADTAAFSIRKKLDYTSAVRDRDNSLQVEAGPAKKKKGAGKVVGLIALVAVLLVLPALASK